MRQINNKLHQLGVPKRAESSLLFILVTLLLSSILLSSLSYAQPMPLGLDGVVYDLDAITRAGNNVKFSVQNINSGYYVQGNLRRDGSYSVVINGNPGDTIIVKAWTDYNSVTSEPINIYGVMHGFNLLLDLSMPNTPPGIISEPLTLAYEDSVYQYDVDAVDDNDDSLLYSLIIYPENMTIENQTGIITWEPHQEDVGLYNISVLVSDGELYDMQEYQLEVIAVNDAPFIISNEITSATVNELYVYDVEAYDEDSENLTFSLIDYPQGMNINSNTGVILWMPSQAQIGGHNVTIRVSDGYLYGEQSFEIIVNGFVNTNPVITSQPLKSMLEDSLYQYDVEAYDAENNLLNYALEINPGNMTINNATGLISWLPKNKDVGLHEVKIKVSDDYGGYVIQNYTLEVINVNDPPIITSNPITKAYVWYLYKYDVNAYDPDKDKITYSLVEKPKYMFINKYNGRIYWVPFKAGRYKVIVKVNDSVLSVTQQFNIDVTVKKGGKSFIGKWKNQLNLRTLSIENEDSDIINVNYALLGNENETGEYVIVSSSDDMPESIFKVPSQFVYKYLSINNDALLENDTLNNLLGKMIFRVEKTWLNNNTDEIVLKYYKPEEEAWINLNTYLSSQDEEYFYFESDIPSFGDFAVVLDKSPKEVQKVMNENFKKNQKPQLKRPFIITGKITFADNQSVGEGIEYTIRNVRTNDSVKGETRKEYNAYAEIVSGQRGDALEIEIGKEGHVEKIPVMITGDIVKKDIILAMTKEEFSDIIKTSNVKNILSKVMWLLLLMIPFAIIARIGYVYFTKKKL